MIQKLVEYKRFGIGLLKNSPAKALFFGEDWVRLLLQKVAVGRVYKHTLFHLNCLFNQ